jgi:hypothetical protein
LDYYLNENKNATLGYQEKALIENENKLPPSKPLLLQLQEKSKHLCTLIPASFRSIFEDTSLHLVFVDTENDGRTWKLNMCRELSFYSLRLKEWLFVDVDMNSNHEIQMKVCFERLLAKFPEPVVFVHYNYCKNYLEDLKSWLQNILIVICFV